MSETMKQQTMAMNQKDSQMISSLEYSATGDSRLPKEIKIELLSSKMKFGDQTKFSSKA